MPLTPTSELISSAPVVGANVILVEQAEAYVTAAEAQNRAIILQLSENAIRYHGAMAPMARALVAIAESSSAQVGVHADHITDEDLVAEAVELGIFSVMFDASADDDDTNMARTRTVVEKFSNAGVWVEGEIGEIGGKGGAHASGALTAVSDAVTFVERTGVHSLAVAVGSSHHMHTKTALLNHERIAEIAAAVDTPLVLHGSSGVPMSEIRSGIRAGLKKINVATEFSIVFTGAIREALLDGSLTDPRSYLRPARKAMQLAIEEYLGAIYEDQ